MESMQEKINTINIVQGSKSSKTMIRSKFTEMNCILIECPRSIAKSIDLYFLLLS